MSAASFYQTLGIDLPGNAAEVKVRCFANPDAHAHSDRDPSCSVNRATGCYLCHACGSKGGPYDAAIVLGKSKSEAMALLREHGLARENEACAVHPSETGAQAPKQGLTVAEYAAAKGISEDFCLGVGLGTRSRLGAQAVRIPYTDPAGQEVAVQWRLALAKSADGPDERFRWATGAKTCLYGLWGLDAAQRAGRVQLVEGVSDTHTLLSQGYTALGLPGASNWRDERDAAHLEGIGVIFVVVEPDAGGEATLKWVSNSTIRDRVRLVFMPPETKDPSALYLDDPERFRDHFDALLTAAVAFGEHEAAQTKQRSELAWGDCKQLANEPRILERLADDVRRTGLVGEERAVKLTYLAVVSRVLPRPVSAALKGPSAAGKSNLVECVLSFFPTSAYYALSAMSERSLVYSNEPLVHRMLVIYEAAGIEGDFASYLMRSLLSEGCVRYETVEKTTEGLRGLLIERPGPTGLITTTTKLSLHPENETRLISVPVTDTADQTRAVMLALADEGGTDTDRKRWHALSEWLDGAGHEVTIPFAEQLAELIPPVAIRLRRDFGQVLALIKAHAILHQATRDRNDAGRIVAALYDYRAVYDLVNDLISEGVEQSVSREVRETVEAVRKRIEGGRPHVLATELVEDLHLDRRTVGRRVAAAMVAGWLVDVNEAKRRTAPKHLKSGRDIPGDGAVLPDPDRLAAALGRLSVEPCASPRPSDITDVKGDLAELGRLGAPTRGVHPITSPIADAPSDEDESTGAALRFDLENWRDLPGPETDPERPFAAAPAAPVAGRAS